MSSIRSALANARGLGTAKTGTAQFWAQRVTAVALVPLTLWFVASLASKFGADYESMTDWLSSPIQATLLAVYLIAIFHHIQLGLQSIIADYIHNDAAKLAATVAVQLLSYLLAAASIISVIMIFVGAD